MLSMARPGTPVTGISEEYRIVKRELIRNFGGAGNRPILPRGHRVLIASANPGEGKTFSAVNLALSLAVETDHDVLLIDADIAKPSVLEALGLEDGPGLMDALADAHLTIFWRSVKLSLMTTLFTFVVGFPTAWFIATRPASQRALWLFLITIPFWTNLLIRTYAINEVIRAEGLLNLFLMSIGVISEPLMLIYTDIAIIIGMTYVNLPLMVLPLFAAIDR